MSMSDYMAAGMGSGITDKLTLGTLNNLARNRGTSAVARGSYGLSRLAQVAANKAAAARAPTFAGLRLSPAETTAAFTRAAEPGSSLMEYFLPRDEEDERMKALIELLQQKKENP
jgi:hypothetical protein